MIQKPQTNQKSNKKSGELSILPSKAKPFISVSQELKSKSGSGQKSKKESAKSIIKDVKLGKIYTLKITALGPKNLGIDEFSTTYSILIPNTQIGDIVKAKILKISNKTSKYAIAQVITKIKTKGITKNAEHNLKVGDLLDINPTKINSYVLPSNSSFGKGLTGMGKKEVGIVQYNPNYSLVIPNSKLFPFVLTNSEEIVKVQITRIKAKYAFARLLVKPNLKSFSLQQNETILDISNKKRESLKEGSKIQLRLPLKVKRFVDYFILKVNGKILVVKENLGAKPGDLIKINCFKELTFSKLKVNGILFGKIIEKGPMLAKKKKILVQGTIRQMLQNGLHFGERTVKCHARMKKYIWLRKKGSAKNKPLIQKGRNLINLFKTRRCLNKALMQLSKYALKGRNFLFVGTKKSITRLIFRVSFFLKNSFFVNTRWLGGLLTNWKSILKSIKKIRPILKQKQTILNEILQKRQSIKNRLMQKAIIFRKKSKNLVKKARFFLEKLKNFKGSQTAKNNDKRTVALSQKGVLLNTKRKQLLSKGESLLEIRKKLLQKNYLLLKQTVTLKQKSLVIFNQYKDVLNELITNRTKVRELITLFILANKINEKRVLAKTQTNRLALVSYVKFKDLLSNQKLSNSFVLIPNPPKEIISKIVSLLKKQLESVSQKQLNSSLKNAALWSIATSSLKTTDSREEASVDKAKQKILILSKLLNNFSLCLPFIEKEIKQSLVKNKELEEKLISLKNIANSIIKKTLLSYKDLQNKLKQEVKKINEIILKQRPIVRVLKRKIKKVVAQKRLIKFLPKLRFLPTPQIKVSETVDYLMKNIVDPKLKYPIELIYDEKVRTLSKKIGAARKKRWQRLEKYFGGIAKMTKMKKNQVKKNIAIIIGQKDEMNAIRECQKLGIKTFQILDTNCNPTFADHFIPANDDSRNSLEYLLKSFLLHIRLAQKLRSKLNKRVKKIKIPTYFKKNNTRKAFFKMNKKKR